MYQSVNLQTGFIKTRVILFFVVFQLLAYTLIQVFYNYTYSHHLIAEKHTSLQKDFLLGAEQVRHQVRSMEQQAAALAISGELLHRETQISPVPLSELRQQAERLLLNQFEGFDTAIGGGLWYEPFTLVAEQRLFGPFVFWQEGQLQTTWALGDETYNYPEQDWYTMASERQFGLPSESRPYFWSDPYFDDTGTHTLMITVDAVMRDNDGGALGLATVDWSLTQLSAFLDTLLDQENKSYLIHRPSQTLLSSFDDTTLLMKPVTKLHWGHFWLIEGMTKQGELQEFESSDGKTYLLLSININEQLSYVLLRPLDDIYRSVNQFSMIVMTIGVAIAAIFISIIYVMLRWLFRPFDRVLEKINDSIETSEKNQLDVQIKPIYYESQDEFTPIVKALNNVYLQLDSVLSQLAKKNKQLEQIRFDYLKLNEQLEYKVELRTDELNNQRRELAESLQQLQDAQEQIVEQEKHASLGKLVAGVAHEINTPLGVAVTAITTLDDRTRNLTQLAEKGQMRKSDFERFCEEIRQINTILINNLDRAATLVKSFKQVAVDQSSEQPRDVELAEYIEQVIASLTPKFKQSPHSLSFDTGKVKASIYTNPGALAQVITNIIDNALMHAFPDNRKGQICIKLNQSDDKIQLVLKDDGVGMDAETKKQLYDPFFTTARARGGSGLGMHLVYNLVYQQLKATISCASTPNKGTRFTITLPMDIRNSKKNRRSLKK